MKSRPNGKRMRFCPFCRGGQRGAVLVTTVLVFAFLSVLGMSAVTFLLNRSVNSTLQMDRLKAFYLAEAGIAHAVYELRKDEDTDGNGVGNILKKDFNGGTYKAAHNFQESVITATGEFNDIERVVQIKYSAL